MPVNGWFPSINANGEIASGAGEIFFQGQSFGHGTTPVFIGADHIAFNADTVTKVVNVRDSKDVQEFPVYAPLCGSDVGIWSGFVQAGNFPATLYDRATVIDNMTGNGPYKLSPNGQYVAHIESFHNPQRVVLNGSTVYEGTPMSVELSNSAMVIVIATGVYTRKILVRKHTGELIDCSIHSWEDARIADDGSGQPWVLSTLQNGTMLRKAGSFTGKFWPGELFVPAFRFVGGKFMVVGSEANGTPKFAPMDQPDIDLRTISGPVVTPPAPTPSPTPTPEPKPTMPVAPNKFDVVQRVKAEHPEINTTVDGERGKLTDYVVLALGGKPWGRKDRDRDPNNNNNSDDALCYLLSDGRFEIYDIINGGDGSPSWDYKGTFADGENGYFREVAGTPVTPQPGDLPSTAITVTVFSAAEVLRLMQAMNSKFEKVIEEVKADIKNAVPAGIKREDVLAILDNLKFAIETDNGHYFSAMDGGGGIISSQRPEPGKPVEGYVPDTWETFKFKVR